MTQRCIAWAAAVGLVCCLSARSEPLTETDRLQLADGLYARAMHELALKEYEAFLRDFTNSPKADVVHFRMGECRRQLGDRIGADREFRRVFREFPQSSYRLPAGVKRADLAMELGQFSNAVDLLQEVLQEQPAGEVRAMALYALGTAQQKLGRRAEAAAAFEQTRREHADSAYAAYAALSAGRLYDEQGAAATNAAEAAELWERAAERYAEAAAKPATDRVGAEALFQAGALWFRRGQFDKSAEAYRQLLSRYPRDERAAEARLPAAWAAHNAGRYAEALAQADAALAGAGPDDAAAAEWLYLQANCRRQLLQHEPAVAAYDALLNRFPDCPFAAAARYEKALALYKLQRYRAAAEELAAVEAVERLRKDVYWLLAECYAALSDDPRATQYYRLIVRDYPQSETACDAAYRLAYRLRAQGALAEAAQYYHWVAEHFPRHNLAAPALFAAGAALAQDGKHAEAVRDWAELLRRYPDSAPAEEALYQKGVSEVRLRRDAEAQGSFGRLLERFPASRFAADAQYWLGMLHREGGRWAEAIARFRRALESRPREDLAPEIRYQLAVALQQTGQMEEAAALLRELLAGPVRSGLLAPAQLAWLAGYSLERGAWQDAARAAELLTATNQPAAAQRSGWSLLGRARLAQGEKAAAETAFRRCLELPAAGRESAEAALALADLARERADTAGATAFYTQAAALAADDALMDTRARAYAGLGRAARDAGDAESAARYFLSVAILYDDPELAPECLYEAAAALRQLGRAEEAARTLAELKQRYPNSAWAQRPPPATP